jgi:hypothetical protein
MTSNDEMPSGNMEREKMKPRITEESEMPSGNMEGEKPVESKNGDEMPTGDMNKD